MAMALTFAITLGTIPVHAQLGGLGRAIESAAGNATSKAFSKEMSIEKIPATFEEFQALQDELGSSPESCIALQLVAMEMYRRDKAIGAQCLMLNNTETNFMIVKRRLDELFRENDSYARPYLVASFFKGATPANGYNPDKPYTIRVRKNPNRQDERSQILKGYVKHYLIYSDGYDSPWRGISVVQQKGDAYYRVSNCDILVQCKEIDFDATDDWHGLE